MILFTFGLFDKITRGIGNAEISFPMIIGIVLSIAFIINAFGDYIHLNFNKKIRIKSKTSY